MKIIKEKHVKVRRRTEIVDGVKWTIMRKLGGRKLKNQKWCHELICPKCASVIEFNDEDFSSKEFRDKLVDDKGIICPVCSKLAFDSFFLWSMFYRKDSPNKTITEAEMLMSDTVDLLRQRYREEKLLSA